MDGFDPKFKLFRTLSTSSWSSPLSKIVLNYLPLSLPPRNAVLDPSLAYVYIPSADLDLLMEYMAAMFPDFKCSINTKSCKSKERCRQNQVVFNFELGNVDFPTWGVKRKVSDFMVAGEKVGEDQGTCVLAVFPIEQGMDQGTWYLGSYFMRHYYTVFDMTPSTIYGMNHFTIGVGLKNEINPMLVEDIVEEQKIVDSAANDEQRRQSIKKAEFEQRRLVLMIVGATTISILTILFVIACCIKVREKRLRDRNDSQLVSAISMDSVYLSIGEKRDIIM